MLNRLTERKTNPALYYTALALLVVALFVAGLKIGSLVAGQPAVEAPVAPSQPGRAVVNPPTKLNDFTLTDHNGQPFSLSDLHGRAVLLFFGYTHCPDECPLTLATFTRTKQLLGDAARDVAFVFISVDGQRDTPQVINDYLKQFDADFIGLTGDASELRRVGANFGSLYSVETVAAETDDHHDATEAGELDHHNYFVQHTSPTFMIDREGVLRLVYFYGSSAEALAEGARQILTPQ
ncbi:MAG: SCO family protein [Chloroflexi bacterium]|nr:SCO family protein [Chloroflexota bacterium]